MNDGVTDGISFGEIEGPVVVALPELSDRRDASAFRERRRRRSQVHSALLVAATALLLSAPG